MWLFCGTVIAHHPPNGSARCILSLLRGSSAWPGLLAPKKKREEKNQNKSRIAAGRAISHLGGAATHGQPSWLAGARVCGGGELLLQCFCFGLHITFIAGLLQNGEGRVNCRVFC